MRDHALLLPLFALALNVLAVGLFSVQTRAMRQDLQLQIASNRLQEPRTAVPVVQVEPGPALQLNNQRVATLGDLRYQLGRTAASGKRVAIIVAPGVSADLLTQLLELCSQVGFTNVSVEMAR